MSIRKKLLKAALKEEIRKERGKRAKRRCPGCRVLGVFGKLFAALAAVYALLFTVFFFDLDGKLLYYVVEPLLVKHYDKMERRNPLDMPYDMK